MIVHYVAGREVLYCALKTKKPTGQSKLRLWKNSFACYAEDGFASVGIKVIAKACGYSVPNLYQYFDNLDDLIVNATLFSITQGCMSTNTVRC